MQYLTKLQLLFSDFPLYKANFAQAALSGLDICLLVEYLQDYWVPWLGLEDCDANTTQEEASDHYKRILLMTKAYHPVHGPPVSEEEAEGKVCFALCAI